jgi:hypothetical protein
MKKLLLSLALLLCVGSTFGQTPQELMAKYKAFTNAEYKDNTEESRKDLLESEAKGESGLSPEDYDFIRNNFKRSEQVQLVLDDAQKAQLAKDLQALKGDEMLFTQNDNSESAEGKNLVQSMINSMFSSDFQLRFFGKVKDNIIDGLIVRCDIWGKVVLAYMDCKLKKEHLMNAFFKGYKANLEVDSDVTDMKDAIKEVKDGNALFVINGEEHPELHSEKDAIEYMRVHNISWNHESWVVGGAVKEKYPNTDRKVVIEYTDEPKK